MIASTITKVQQVEQAEKEILAIKKEVNFFMTEYNLEIISLKMERQEFYIPDYQRNFTWDDDRKSRFLESLIMGLPVPFLFFWETPKGELEVIDGSQRLRTIEQYVTNNLTLVNLDKIPSLIGTKFEDLPRSRQLKILNIPIRGAVLGENADEAVRFDMFERINTGSLTAKPVEVRRGALRGEFQNLIEKLAQEDLLSKLAPISQVSKNLRTHDDMVTRFFAYGDGLDTYKDSPKNFLFSYVKKMNQQVQKSQMLLKDYEERFKNMLKFVDLHFPNGFTKSTKAKATPQVRFEAIAIGVDLAIRKNPLLLKSTAIDVSWLNCNEFIDLVSSGSANVKSKIENRINFVASCLLQVAND